MDQLADDAIQDGVRYKNLLKTEDEILIKMYSYLYETEGVGSASRYLSAIEDNVNQIMGQKKAEEFLKKLVDEENMFDVLYNHLNVTGQGTGDGIKNFAQGIKELILPDKVNTVHDYETMYIIQGLQGIVNVDYGDYTELLNKIKDKDIKTEKKSPLQKLSEGDLNTRDVSDEIIDLKKASEKEENLALLFNYLWNSKGKEDAMQFLKDMSAEIDKINKHYDWALDNNYEISQSIGNMLPSIAISLINPGLGTASMGLSAGGNASHQALVAGASEETAIVYGTLIGLSEAGLERILGGIPGLSDVNVVDFQSYIQSMGKEGFEEFIQTYIENGLNTALLDSDFDLMSTSLEALKSAMYGSITAGVMNSASLGVNKINQSINNRIDGMNHLNNDIEILEVSENTDGGGVTQFTNDIEILENTFDEIDTQIYQDILNNNQEIIKTLKETSEKNYQNFEQLQQTNTNSEIFENFLNRYLEKVMSLKSVSISTLEKVKTLGSSIKAAITGNYDIGFNSATFENIDSTANAISDVVAYADDIQLNAALNQDINEVANVLTDGVLMLHEDNAISNQATLNFKNNPLKSFFTTSISNMKNANQIFSDFIAHLAKMDAVESNNINKNIIGKFLGGLVYEYFSGTTINKRKYTPITNSESMMQTISNDGILHFASPSSIRKILESGTIKHSSFIESDLTAYKSFFFAGTPTFEDLLINIPAYEVMQAIRIKPTEEQIRGLKYRPLDDRAVVYDGNFNFTENQVEIAYFGLDFDSEKNSIYLKELTKEQAANYKAPEQVKKAYNYQPTGNKFMDSIKMNAYGLYAQYKHHQRLLSFTQKWEKLGLKLNEISDNELVGVANINSFEILEDK